jgi:hypothetical protein
VEVIGGPIKLFQSELPIKNLRKEVLDVHLRKSGLYFRYVWSDGKNDPIQDEISIINLYPKLLEN